MFSSKTHKGLAGFVRVLTRNYQRPRAYSERELAARPTSSATCPCESVLPIRPQPDFLVVFEGYAGEAEHRRQRQEARKRSLRADILRTS